MYNNFVLHLLSLLTLSLLPSYLLAKGFRFAFYPAMQIYFGDTKARQWVKVSTLSIFSLAFITLFLFFS